ncbi:MAG TPA: hypothetical protein ENJ60_02635 [Aeromonadales bacterium]|nr:hypothetical protein [Aeromonadales bacterium]
MKYVKLYLTLVLIALGMGQVQAKSGQVSANCGTVKTSINGIPRTIQGKPGAGVCLTYQVPQKINPGERFVVELSLTNNRNKDLRSEIKMAKELHFLTKTRSLQKTADAISQGNRQLLTFTAEKKGFYYIYVNAQTGFAENRRTSVFAIPVNVGGVNPRDYLKANGTLKTTASGEQIVSMKASQTIR